MSYNPYTQGIRRTIKIYGPVDPVMEARRKRHDREYGRKLMRPHAGLKTSVKERIRP